jgi:hypothetical protein
MCVCVCACACVLHEFNPHRNGRLLTCVTPLFAYLRICISLHLHIYTVAMMCSQLLSPAEIAEVCAAAEAAESKGAGVETRRCALYCTMCHVVLYPVLRPLICLLLRFVRCLCYAVWFTLRMLSV